MPIFPRQQLTHFLRGWYRDQMTCALRSPKPAEEAKRSGGTVFDIYPELSSVSAVPVLLRLGDILGYEPTRRSIKPGGYRSEHDFVSDMLTRLANDWPRRRPVTRPTTQNVAAYARA